MAANKVKTMVLTMAVVGMMTAATGVDARGRGGRNLDFTTLDKAPMGPWMAEMNVMCRSAEEWNVDMEQMVADGRMMVAVPAPQIDWKTQSVVLISMGQRNTMGYDIRVTGVSRRGSELVVEVQASSPTGGFTTPTLSAPFHMIAVDTRGAKSMRVTQAIAAVAPSADDHGAESVTWGSLKQSYLPR